MPWRTAPRGARLLAAAVICAGLIAPGCSSSRHAQPAPSPADPLAAAIAASLDHYTTTDRVRAIIVQVGGRTRFERYYSSAADQYQNVMSVTKSVTSTLVGIAIGEGRLRLDEPLSQMLPRYAARMTASVARVTLRQLLTMTGGFPDTFTGAGEDALFAAPDRTAFILTHQDSTPGREFHYSDYGVHLLSPILAQATGQSALGYARTKLFGPLGIATTPGSSPPLDEPHLREYLSAGFSWPTDPQGFNTTAGFLKLRPRDLAAFGQLFLQGGKWNERQVVPTAWVQQATTAEAGAAFAGFHAIGAFDPSNYGYLWWVKRVGGQTAYFAHGLGGQLVEVVPALRLVIAMSSFVDLTNPNAITVEPDVEQSIADAIVNAIGPARGPS
jgi:CubicO group peptidase (beta-lactamase class C family)